MADENIEKIDLRCPNCKVKIRAPVSLIGKKAKCPRCQSIFDVVEPDVPLAPIETEEPKAEQPSPPSKPVTTASKAPTGVGKPVTRPIAGAPRPTTGRPMGAKPLLRPTTAGRKFGPPPRATAGMKFAKPVGAEEDEGVEEGIVEPPKKSKKMLIIIVAAVLLIIVVLVFLFFKKKSGTSGESSTEQKQTTTTQGSSSAPPK